jgi:hypothetical protein
MPDFALDVLRQVSLASGVLDEDHLPDTDDPALTIAGGYFHPGVEIDDVLPARCRVPVDVVLSLGLAKDDPRGRQALGKLAASPLLDPLDFDVPEMRLATGIGSSLSSKNSD